MIKRYIKRKRYLDKIKPFIDKDIIKVIVGQRRVGKSVLAIDFEKNKEYLKSELYMDYIRERHPSRGA